MGDKNSKQKLNKNEKPVNKPDDKPVSNTSNKTTNASEHIDFPYLVETTGMTNQQIRTIFDEFKSNNPDGQLNKNEFFVLYSKLRPEPKEYLDEISNYIFNAFDKDKNGFLSFNEFMVILRYF